MKSGKLAINVLIHLNGLGKKASSTFDFVNKTIEPEEAVSKDSKKLLDDYLDWLPDHFKNHNCDIDKLEKLAIHISADFDNAVTPPGMSKCRQITITTKTEWKAEGKPEETIEIAQDEIVDSYYLKKGIPESN